MKWMLSGQQAAVISAAELSCLPCFFRPLKIYMCIEYSSTGLRARAEIVLVVAFPLCSGNVTDSTKSHSYSLKERRYS